MGINDALEPVGMVVSPGEFKAHGIHPFIGVSEAEPRICESP